MPVSNNRGFRFKRDTERDTENEKGWKVYHHPALNFLPLERLFLFSWSGFLRQLVNYRAWQRNGKGDIA